MKLILSFLPSIFFIIPLIAQSNQEEFANDRLTIKLENHVKIDEFCRDQFPDDVYTIKVIRYTDKGNTYCIIFEKDIDVQNYTGRFSMNPKVVFAEPDYIGSTGGEQIIIPNDTYFETRQWGLYNTGTFPLSPSSMDADTDMELAWDFTTGDENLIIAILDSGLKLDHPEIVDNLWYNPVEVANGIDDDNNGYIDDVNTGWDFVNEDNLPKDDLGHGTNVTGIIGAKGDNNKGYAGINWNSKLMNLKVINGQNSGLYSWWTEAIYYAVDNGAKIINMSLGGSGYSASMEEAIDYAYENGVTVVACMMNTNTASPYYPAAYENTIAVGATNPNDERAVPFFWNIESGSNYGAHIDLIAPGNFTYGLNYTSNTNYGTYWGGTSQAAPHVVGVISLLLSIDPDLSIDQILEILTSTADDEVGKPSEDTPGFDNYHGHGRLNAYQALLQLNSVSNKDSQVSNQFNILPNPLEMGSSIKFDWTELEIKSIKILNTEGKILYSEDKLENTNELSIDDLILNAGIYLVVVNCQDAQQFVKRLVVGK